MVQAAVLIRPHDRLDPLEKDGVWWSLCHVQIGEPKKRSKVLELSYVFFSVSQSSFEKWLLVCNWALVETEYLDVGYPSKCET